MMPSQRRWEQVRLSQHSSVDRDTYAVVIAFPAGRKSWPPCHTRDSRETGVSVYQD